MTYDDGLDRISEATEVKEAKYTNIEKKISRNNASQDVPVVNEGGFDNVAHQVEVGREAAKYRLEWDEKGCLPDDVEVVDIGEGNQEVADGWRAALRGSHKKLEEQCKDKPTYITANTEGGQISVSQSSHEFFVPSEGIDGVDLDKDVRNARPAIYMRATKGEKTTELHRAGKGGSDWFEGFPIDQLTTAYADIKLRKIKGTIYVILDEDVERKIICAKGKSHLYNLIRRREVGSVFMKSPNRGNDDAVEIRMMLDAEKSCNGLKFYFSEDSGKDPLLSADKEAERKILRNEALVEFKSKEAAIEKPFTATLSASDLQLHNFMKNKVVNKKLNERFLKTVVSHQEKRNGAPSPWIVEILQEKNKKRKGSIKNVQQEEYHQPEKKQKIHYAYSKTDERMVEFEKNKLEQQEQKLQPRLDMAVSDGQASKRPSKQKTSQRWSDEEHLQFEKGCALHGWGNWKRIAEVVPTRDILQIRSHAQKYKSRLAQKYASPCPAASGWTSHVDDKSGRTFYYNAELKKSVWK